MEAQSNLEISRQTTLNHEAEKNKSVNTNSAELSVPKTSAGSKPKSNKSPRNKQPQQQQQQQRRGNHGATSRHYENYGLEHDAPLYGIDRLGVKKTNLNHLLNFTFKSRDPTDSYYEYEKTTKNFFSTKLSKGSVFSKEQFLQANCQFVIKDGGDYAVHMADPDRLVDWNKIEEIRIETLEPIACPICLYEPTCGKMTKCGHIFCWSCILHYLSLSDKTWRKCPICNESIYKSDLKSVQIIKHEREFKVGDEIKMNLMFRFKNKYNTVILPFSLYETFIHDEKSRKNVCFDLFDSAKYGECKQFFKFHSKSPLDIFESIVRRERHQLERQIKEEKDQPEVCFVSEALHLLSERETQLMAEIEKSKRFARKSNSEVAPKVEAKVVSEIKVDGPVEIFADAFENLVLEKANKQAEVEVKVPEVEKEEPKEEPKEAPEAEIVQNFNINDVSFFYQSSDGQRIYINGLNNRCLLAEYSSFSKCPLTLSAKIQAIESIFMTEDNRKRFKYLGHLPLHTEFKQIELELKPILSQKTLDMFSAEMQERVRMRKKIENKEKREAERIAALNESSPHYYVQSAMNEPVHYIKSAPIEPVIDYETEFPEASSSPPISSGASVSEVSTASSQGGVPHKSFAQMLRVTEQKESPVGNVPQNAWPSLDSPATSSNSSTQLSGWVTMAKQQTQQQSMLGRAKRYQNPPSPWDTKPAAINEKNDDEDTEEMPAPLYKQSFFSAIDESLKQFESKKKSEASEEGSLEVSVQDKSKKKKKTKKLLFSNSLNMGF